MSGGRGIGSADNIRAGGLFRLIHHNRAPRAERTGFPFGPSLMSQCRMTRYSYRASGDFNKQIY